MTTEWELDAREFEEEMAAEMLDDEARELEQARLEWLADEAAQEGYREWLEMIRRNEEQPQPFADDEIPF